MRTGGLGAGILVVGVVLGWGAGGRPAVADARQDRLIKVERELIEKRAALVALLGQEAADALLTAQIEVRELKPWVDRYRGFVFHHLKGQAGPVSLVALEKAVTDARAALEGWEQDDRSKGQGEGPQTAQAREDLAAAAARLAGFQRAVLDPAVARQRALAQMGIQDFATLDARHAAAAGEVQRVRTASREADTLRRRIESLEAERQRLADALEGGAVWERVDVLRNPVGEYEWSVPAEERPMGGSWRRYSVSERRLQDVRHFLQHGKFTEHWTFGVKIEPPAETVRGGEELVIACEGTVSWKNDVPEDQMSGQGLVFDARTDHATRVDGDEKLRLSRLAQSDARTFRFRTPQGGTEFSVWVFTWNNPISVLWVYRRKAR